MSAASGVRRHQNSILFVCLGGKVVLFVCLLLFSLLLLTVHGARSQVSCVAIEIDHPNAVVKNVLIGVGASVLPGVESGHGGLPYTPGSFQWLVSIFSGVAVVHSS